MHEPIKLKAKKTRLLFCSGDSGNRFTGDAISIADEHNAIIRAIESAKSGINIKPYQPLFNVTRASLVQGIALRHAEIIHFAGHGEDRRLAVINEHGVPQAFSANEVRAVFASLPVKPTLVILNACHSLSVAKIVTEFVPFAIGTPKTLWDRFAVNFAFNLYTLLSTCSLASAFELSLQATGVGSIQKDECPRLLRRDGPSEDISFFFEAKKKTQQSSPKNGSASASDVRYQVNVEKNDGVVAAHIGQLNTYVKHPQTN